ncbi:hypothetical protein ACFL1G_05330 [Planctomycetota bacterium]
MLWKKQTKWKLIILLTAVVNVLLFMGIAVSTTRALEPGDLDPTFGEGGMVAIDFLASQADHSRGDVAIQPDGKVVVVGASWSADTGNDFALTRYNPDGSLDTSFGDGGMVTSSRGSGVHDATSESATGVAIDSYGRIIVAGASAGFVVARYSPDGSLDTGFGNNGWVNTDVGYYDRDPSVVIDEYDRIVVAGHSGFQTDGKWQNDFSLVRYKPDGSLDTTFGMDLDGDGTKDGIAITDFGLTDDRAGGVSIDSQKRIVVAGMSRQPTGLSYPPSADDFAIARYNPDGSLDTSFDEDGKVLTDFGLGSWAAYYANAVAVDSADRIIAAGHGAKVGGVDFLLARYNEDGSLDATFDGDGMVATNFIGSSGAALSVAIDWQGGIVAAGYSYFQIDGTWQYDFALARYDDNGSLDTDFGDEGKVTTDFDNASDFAYGVAIDGAGKIVAAGYAYPYNAHLTVDESSDFALARYNIDGSLDTSFDEDGKVTTDFIASNTDVGRDVVAVQSDGKILAVGWSDGSATSSVFALARLNTDGSLDATFGTDGKVMTLVGDRGAHAKSVALDEYDRIVVAGTEGPGDFLLARYNSDGSLDTSFGGDGKVTAEIGSNNQQDLDGMTIGPDGKIVAVGWAQLSGGDRDFALARYNLDGSLDTSFGGDGIVTTDFGGPGADEIRNVAVQADGKIIAVGRAGWIDFGVVRYNVDGSLDTTFGNGGIASGVNSWAYGVVIDADGKIVVAGYDSSRRLALARYNTDGSLDPTFATFDEGGIVYGMYLSAFDVVIDAQGRIVVAGAPWPGFKVGRFNSDGSPDLSFGNNGIARSNFGGYWEMARGVDVDWDGNIVVVGHSWLPGTGRGYDFIITRFIGQSNQAPVADAGDNLVIASADQAYTMLYGMATDPDGDLLDYRWLEGEQVLLDWSAVGAGGEAYLDLGTLPYFISIGNHTLTLEVYDGQITTSDDMILTIQNSPPEAQPAPSSQDVQIGIDPIVIVAQVSDFDGDLLSYEWLKDGVPLVALGNIQTTPGGDPIYIPELSIGPGDLRFPLGEHQIELRVDDSINEPMSAFVSVNVIDTTDPSLIPIPSDTMLWPADHQMHDITIQANAFDNGGGAITLSVEVISSEPEDGIGDGSTEPDFVIVSIDSQTGLIELQLRAERAGKGDGRTYTIIITATDASGNSSTAEVQILAPHDKSKK